jgi:glycosyltransferase involved in cell wall biosynthesis
MRVLVIVPDKYTYGGTSRFLERLLDLHGRQHIETAVLVPESAFNEYIALLTPRFAVEVIAVSNCNGSNTSPFLTPLFDSLFSWRTVRSWIPDLIVVSTGDPGRMSVALYYPVPVLYILHSTPEYRFRFLPRCYLRLGLLFNNMVMTVSRAAAETISYVMGIPREKIAVVHNSCQSVQHPVDARLPVVLTVGHVVSYKNPAGWLAVAQMVIQARPDVSFVWVGDGELLDSMRAEINALGLDNRIRLPGFVSEPSTWYETAQIYFQPSLRESHGIAVLEAMAHGLPCVVANTGGLPESVVDEETGYVCPPTDPASYAGRITELLGDAVLRERMGAAGQQRVKLCFSDDIQENKIMALYGLLTKNEKKH